MERVVLLLSDQQIVTGIGILLAGYGNLIQADVKQGVSAYHWQVVGAHADPGHVEVRDTEFGD